MSERAIADAYVKFTFQGEGGGLRPGRALLSRRRVLLATGEGHIEIPLEGIVDVTAGYVPEGTADLIDDAVTIRYERGETSRRLILQGPRERLEPFAVGLYTAILSGMTPTVKHPAREGGMTTNVAPRTVAIEVHDWGVEFARQGSTFAIRQSEVTGIDRAERRFDGDRRPALVVDHRRGDAIVTTEIAAGDRARLNVLGRYLGIEYRSLLADVRDMETSGAELEALVALYSMGGTADPERFVTRGEADGIGDALREKGLVTDDWELTRLGRAVMSDRIGEIDT